MDDYQDLTDVGRERAEREHCERVVRKAGGGRYGLSWVYELVLSERAAAAAGGRAELQMRLDAANASLALSRGELERVTKERDAFNKEASLRLENETRLWAERKAFEAQLATERAAREVCVETIKRYEMGCEDFKDTYRENEWLKAQHARLRAAAERAVKEWDDYDADISTDVCGLEVAADELRAALKDTPAQAAPSDAAEPCEASYKCGAGGPCRVHIPNDAPIAPADKPPVSTAPISTAWYPADAVESLLEVLDGGSDDAIEATAHMVRAAKVNAPVWPDPALVRELLDLIDAGGNSHIWDQPEIDAVAVRLRAADPEGGK